MSARDKAWEAYLAEHEWIEYPDTARDAFNAAWDAATERAYVQAARIAQQDSTSVTLLNLSQFPLVRITGERIAFNIQALASKESR